MFDGYELVHDLRHSEQFQNLGVRFCQCEECEIVKQINRSNSLVFLVKFASKLGMCICR